MAYSSIFRLAAILSLSLMGYLGRPLNIETTFRVSTGCAHGFGFFFFAGPSVTVIAILLIHITDVKTVSFHAITSLLQYNQCLVVWNREAVVITVAEEGVAVVVVMKTMSAWRRRRMRGIEKMWNGSSTSDMETMDLGLF
ncbi:hypothetical protein YC2023_118901 [Brassica napus]